jgi:SAM-dependent methyltransferase
MNKRALFYSEVLSEIIGDRKASILVCGGGSTDKEVLEELGFTNVTISNLDERMDSGKWTPFEWKFENMESLSFKDGSYDYVITHATIHHASSPHKALTEMYRVAQKGVLAFEARDSITMRFLKLFRFADTYEQAAVYYNDCKYGGVNNSDIPNYIFRWTEREVEKTIKSYAPYAEHRFCYRYGTAISGPHELEKKGGIKSLFFTTVRPLFVLLAKVFPRQQNMFAFYIEKPTLPDMLFPWLRWNNGDISFNKEWGDHKYKHPTES